MMAILLGTRLAVSMKISVSVVWVFFRCLIRNAPLISNFPNLQMVNLSDKLIQQFAQDLLQISR